MKQTIQISALIIFTLLVVVPPPAFAEVKISLRNGREIIADSCSDSKDRLTCHKMGGIFEIEKKDILDVRSINITPRKADEGPVPEPASGAEGQKDSGKATAGTEGPSARLGANPEQERQLADITKRMLKLQQEGDRLNQEREKLNAEYKAQGAVAFPEVYDSFQKRYDDIAARINRFNEEVKKLNAEKSAITGGVNKGK
jgi:hypothetical protein